jgi:hypothetical protein
VRPSLFLRLFRMSPGPSPSWVKVRVSEWEEGPGFGILGFLSRVARTMHRLGEMSSLSRDLGPPPLSNPLRKTLFYWVHTKIQPIKGARWFREPLTTSLTKTPARSISSSNAPSRKRPSPQPEMGTSTSNPNAYFRNCNDTLYKLFVPVHIHTCW